MDDQLLPRRGPVVAALVLGAGVAVALGVYGRAHTGDYSSLPSLGFSSAGTFKAWATSVVLVLALGQVVGALWLYGRLPGAPPAPAWLGGAHRAGGLLFTAIVLLWWTGALWFFVVAGVHT